MAIDFITDWLAVGAREDALSAEALSTAGIDFVLSLVLDAEAPGVRQVQLEVDDRKPLPAWTIARAVEIIASEIDAGRRVLVHCHMGISRSPAIVLCYLHERCGLSMPKALAVLRRARPCAAPHPVLLASIAEHYDRIGDDSLRRRSHPALVLEGIRA